MKMNKKEKSLLSSIERGEWKVTTEKSKLRIYEKVARQMTKQEFREILDELKDKAILNAVASGRKSIRKGSKGVKVQKLFRKIKSNLK